MIPLTFLVPNGRKPTDKFVHTRYTFLTNVVLHILQNELRNKCWYYNITNRQISVNSALKECSMSAYRHTVVVLPLHHVFGSHDLSLLCLSGIDLQMYMVVRLLAA